MKRLVTEADVRRMVRGAKLVVDRDTIVTPSARDAALLSGVTIVEERASARAGFCAACGAGGTCGCPAAPKLGEGDWLVSVRDGRVTARRVGD